jgi:hypothetical protein
VVEHSGALPFAWWLSWPGEPLELRGAFAAGVRE